jgi:hypothetical protein
MDAHKPELSTDAREEGLVPERKSDGVSLVRRELVKRGAFIPPALLTLRSGAVTAAVSNPAACVVKARQAARAAQETHSDFELAKDADEWLRARVTVRAARRVRKKKGKWMFKSSRTVALYTHDPVGVYAWWSVRPGRTGRKWNYQDAGQIIEVFDAQGTTMLAVGTLMYRNRNARRRYVGIHEEQRYGIVVTDKQGNVLLDEEGKPLIEAIITDEEIGAQQNISASCWASLSPVVQT